MYFKFGGHLSHFRDSLSSLTKKFHGTTRSHKFEILVQSVVYLLWVAYSLPARMSPDSFADFGQVLSGNWSDWHTLTYTLFIYVTSIGGRAIWLVAFVQLAMLVLAVNYYVRSIVIKSSPFRAIILGLISISPLIGPFATTIWHDVPYIAFVLVSLGIIIRICNTIEFDSRLALALFFSFAGVILFRHNGWPTLLVFSIIWFLFSFYGRSVARRRASLIGIIAVLIVTPIQLLSPKMIHDAETPAWFPYMPIVANMTYAVANDLPGSNKYRTEVMTFAGPETLRGSLVCQSLNGVIFAPDFNGKKIETVAPDLILLFAQELVSNPRSVLAAHECRTRNFVPSIFQPNTNYYYWLQGGIIENNLEIKSINLPALNFVGAWENFITKSGPKISRGGDWWLASLFLLLFALVMARFKLTYLYNESILTFAWCSSVLLILLLVAPAQDVRYSLPIMIPVFVNALSLLSMIVKTVLVRLSSVQLPIRL